VVHLSNSRSDHHEAVQWLIEQCSRSDDCRKLIEWAIWCRIERSLQSQEIPLSWAVLVSGANGGRNRCRTAGTTINHLIRRVPSLSRRLRSPMWTRGANSTLGSRYGDAEAADALGISLSTFRRMRTGKSPVSAQTARLVALNVRVFPDAWQADYDDDEAEFEERYGRRILRDKLITGELKATGFKLGAPLDSPPTTIHPAYWRVLVPDFETSSASAPGVEVVGIRVLPSQEPPAASTEPVAARIDSPPARRRSAARSVTSGSPVEQMRKALGELLGAGAKFKTQKEAYQAVLGHLGVPDGLRGWSRDNFRRAATSGNPAH
jgi:transcriptional regulator with XRE-family HTH domain